MQKLLFGSTLLSVFLGVIGLIESGSALAQEPVPPPAGQSAVPPGAALASPAATPEATARQQVSYALGQNFAANLKGNEIECDLEYLLAGISDVLKNVPPKWTDEQLRPVLQRFSQEMEQKATMRFQQMAARNGQQAAQFLAENAKREGVQTTPSGLQYRVVQQGNGPSPTLNDVVRCNYRGTLLDGTEFDSSAKHGGPAEFPVNGVIDGWTEALQKMRVGDKWQLFVPADLAYGMRPQPGSGIEPNSMLIFDVELLEILQR